MRFRTEIELKADKQHRIEHNEGIVMLGSCFTDNVGALLIRDGFNVCANPFGPLYNPLSIENTISRALSDMPYNQDYFIKDENDKWHCLDFASRYASSDPAALSNVLNSTMEKLRTCISECSTLIITLGTSFVYQWIAEPTPQHIDNSAYIVGNCHKFQANNFNRYMLSADDVTNSLIRISALLPSNIKNLIFTVSPIRHIGDGLHANQLSKSTLLLGINQFICSRSEGSTSPVYFPSYEIMMDDLRDYRFYAADMKHPSDVAIDYIYQHFLSVFCDKSTITKVEDHRRVSLRAAHRPLPTI